MDILITNPVCFQDVYGGSARGVDEISKYLSLHGHRVVLLVQNRKNREKIHYISDNFLIYRYPYSSSTRHLIKNMFSAHMASRWLWKKYKFDIVWGNAPEPWLFIKKNNSRRIYTMHGPWLLESELDQRINKLKYVLISIAYRFLFNKKTLLHFQSDYIYSICSSEYRRIKKNKHIIAPVLINDKSIRFVYDSKYESLIDSNKTNLLLARRLVRRTGVVEFLKTISNFPDDIRKELNIIIVGTGYLSEEISVLVEEMNYSVHYLGHTCQKDLDFLYMAVDYCVMPSINAEGFGVSILESLLRNTPVIYTDSGGMGDFLRNIIPEYGYNYSDDNKLLEILSTAIKSKRSMSKDIRNDQYKINYSFIKGLDSILNA